LPFSWTLFPRATPAAKQLDMIKTSKNRRLRLWSFADWASWASACVLLAMLGLVAYEYLMLQSRADSATRLNRWNAALAPVVREYFKSRQRPLEPGLSAGHLRSVVAGSLCCVVRDRSTRTRRFILGARSFAAVDWQRGDSILQPAPADLGLSAARTRDSEDSETDRLSNAEQTHAVARLRDVKTIEGSPGTAFEVAIAEVLNSVQARMAISAARGGEIVGVAEQLNPGDLVLIQGRTSGVVTATVLGAAAGGTAIHLRFQTGKPPPDEGDVGAPVLTSDLKLAAMVVSTSPTGLIALPIRKVFEVFSVELESPAEGR
jgi:hypothetical protein